MLFFIKPLKIDDYEGSISHLEQALSIFATQLDTCQRFGEDIKECNLNVSTTLFNIGIVHMLNGNFEDAKEVFKRVLKIRESSNDLDYKVSLFISTLFEIHFFFQFHSNI